MAHERATVQTCSFGVFAFGVYPLGLDLAVEAMYPVDEAAGTALIFLSGQVQAGVLIVLSGFMRDNLTAAASEKEVGLYLVLSQFPDLSCRSH